MTDACAISRLAQRLGVLPVYSDYLGEERWTTTATNRALCAALGCDIANEREASERLAALEEQDAARIIPAQIVLRANEPARIEFQHRADWGLIVDGDAHPRASGSGEVADLPPLPMGVHRLIAQTNNAEQTGWLLAAPPSAPSLLELSGSDKVWGVTAALYGFRSSRNAGLGDYRDLAEMASALGRNGAAFLGINPVHAIGAATQSAMISPYSPTHRGYLNPWHIALDGLEPFSGTGSSNPTSVDVAEPLVDYDAAALVRNPALANAFAAFSALSADHSIRARFKAFAADGGTALRDFATFEALSLRHGPDWTRWPQEYRDVNAAAVQIFAEGATDAIEFHIWLQWVANEQLAEAQGAARGSGMALGLYLDLAVGAIPGGAETWTDRSGHAFGATLGAPPDQFGDAVQSWGLAPLSTRGMAAQGYQNFARLLRCVMRHAGAIRIDHALGLGRSFWVPDDGSPGAYVRYPIDSLLAVIAIEATRAGTLIIGEDLGLVPDGFRERLAEAGLYGVDVLQFARGGDGRLPQPHEMRAKSMASFGNHDTPTIAGFFEGRDLDWHVQLGNLDDAGRDWIKGERRALRADMGETPKDWIGHVHRDLARSEAEIVSVQLDDITGEIEQQNIPGVVDGHPNWRRRAGITTEEAPVSAAIENVGAAMRDEGR